MIFHERQLSEKEKSISRCSKTAGKIHRVRHTHSTLQLPKSIFATIWLAIFSIPALAVAPVFETHGHIFGGAWEYPGKWGPYPNPEAACRAEVWQPDWKNYPDHNYRGYAPNTKDPSFDCFCHSNTTGRCGVAIARCPPGYSSGIGIHIDKTPFGSVELSDWSSSCMLKGPDPLKPKGQCAGNPIDVSTGAKIQSETDITFTSGFHTYSISRQYVFDQGGRPDGSLGPKWWLNIDSRLVYQDVLGQQHATIYIPSGRGFRYELTNGQWQTSSDEGQWMHLQGPASPGGNWTLDADGRRYIVNDAGYLISDSSAGLNTSLQRDANNKIMSVVFGTTTATPTYDALSRVSSISVGAQYVDYGYDSTGRLISGMASSPISAEDAH